MKTAQLYCVTGNSKYEIILNNMSDYKGLNWSTVGDYGNIVILTTKNISKNSSIYTKSKNTIISQADNFVEISSKSFYRVDLTKFNWENNCNLTNKIEINPIFKGIFRGVEV